MFRALTLAALPLALAAPLASPQVPSVAGKYIVVLNPSSKLAPRTTSILQTSLLSTVKPTHNYDSEIIQGFAASLSPAQVAALNADASVAYVERDGFLTTQGVPHASQAFNAKFANPPIETQTQKNTTWGLSRLSNKGTNNTEYRYDASAGAGTCAYIIDTGIYFNHTEFEGRAMLLKNFDTFDRTDDDLFGHGTHVAGTIGSRAYGVAKKSTLIGLKVCNSLGLCQISDILAAMLLAVEDSKTRAACSKGAVINMSLGAPNEDWNAIKQAVKGVADAGVFVAAAAGNNHKDASGFSPASAPEACAVGAMDKSDRIADFSNFGADVAVFAPGVEVLSTSPLGPSATAIMSGTSMASPHIAGLAAYFLGQASDATAKLSPAALCSHIQEKALKDAVIGLPAGTANRLANNGYF